MINQRQGGGEQGRRETRQCSSSRRWGVGHDDDFDHIDHVVHVDYVDVDIEVGSGTCHQA